MEEDYVKNGVTDRIVRFVRKLPHKDNPDLVILKGHLLLEEALKDYLRAVLPNPEALDMKKFGYWEVCNFSAALYKGPFSWLWNPLRELNAIRNQLAHHLDPKDFDARIERFITSISKGWIDPGLVNDLPLAISALYSMLDAIIQRQEIGKNG